MKKTLIALGMGMASGAGITAFMMMNKKTKKNAEKMLNNMMDEANEAMNRKAN